jgi:hypothetical protein
MNTNTMYPPLQRFIVAAPTVVFTMWLGNIGFPVLPRVAAGICVGALMIFGLSRFQRWRATH